MKRKANGSPDLRTKPRTQYNPPTAQQIRSANTKGKKGGISQLEVTLDDLGDTYRTLEQAELTEEQKQQVLEQLEKIQNVVQTADKPIPPRKQAWYQNKSWKWWAKKSLIGTGIVVGVGIVVVVIDRGTRIIAQAVVD